MTWFGPLFASSWFGPLFPDAGSSEPVEPPPLFAGIGPEPAAVLLLDLEAGMRVTYSWATGLFKGFGGKEQRSVDRDFPKQRYAGSAFVFGTRTLAARGALARYAAQGSPFLLGLPFESLVIVADSPGATIAVTSTAKSDWALEGQRVVVIADDDDGFEAVGGVIQGVGASTLELDVELGAVGRPGARVMAGMIVFLEPQQGFVRYPNQEDAIEQWQVSARAQQTAFTRSAVYASLSLEAVPSGSFEAITLRAKSAGVFGNEIQFSMIGDSAPGTGVTLDELDPDEVVVHFEDGVSTSKDVVDALAVLSTRVDVLGDVDPGDVIEAPDDELALTSLAGGADETIVAPGRGAALTTYLFAGGVDDEAFHPVWDRGIDVDNQVGDSIQAMNDIVDLGGVPISVGMTEVPDWGRQISILRGDLDEWQQLKAFLHAVAGRGRMFWLPTSRADLVAVSDGPGGVGLIGDFDIDAAIGDFFAWWPAHRRHLAIEQAAGVTYVEVIDANDHTRARLPLRGPQTISGALERARIQARALGTAGNGITVRFRDNALTTGGELETIGTAITVKFVPGATTVQELFDLLESSTLVELAGEWDPGAVVTSDDEFDFTELAGGEDAPTRITLTIRIDPDNEEAALPAVAPITLVSWLELCRLESDDVEVSWAGARFEMSEIARVVQR